MHIADAFKPIQYFDINPSGRDYVVGDIHGYWDMVSRLMDSVDFDVSADRLFCTGDLIDRGPHSDKVLDYLAEPYFHSVCGNHEEMLLSIQSEGNTAADIDLNATYNGFEWYRSIDDLDRILIAIELAKLPLLIQVATHHGAVGIAHADIPYPLDWRQLIEALSNKASREKTVEEVIWGESRLQHQLTPETVGAIDHVYLGHVHMGKAMFGVGNIRYIDPDFHGWAEATAKERKRATKPYMVQIQPDVRLISFEGKLEK
jgi:serine/threonine protein phosphatase 1